MFKRLEVKNPNAVIYVDGSPLRVVEGSNLAGTLLESDFLPFRRHDISAEPRAPYCMIGKCFDCLTEVDGVANTRSCMKEARDGMRIKTQAPCKDRSV